MDTEYFLELKYVGLHVYSVIGRQLVSFVGEKLKYRGRLMITTLFHIPRVC